MDVLVILSSKQKRYYYFLVNLKIILRYLIHTLTIFTICSDQSSDHFTIWRNMPSKNYALLSSIFEKD